MECITERDYCFPLVPPGAGLDEMILNKKNISKIDSKANAPSWFLEIYGLKASYSLSDLCSETDGVGWIPNKFELDGGGGGGVK